MAAFSIRESQMQRRNGVLQVDEARRVAGLNSHQVAEIVKQQLFLHTQCA